MYGWILVGNAGSLSEPPVDGIIFSVYSVTASYQQETTRFAHSKAGNENLFSDQVPVPNKQLWCGVVEGAQRQPPGGHSVAQHPGQTHVRNLGHLVLLIQQDVL